MKRLLSIVALAAALTLGTGGSAMAHTIVVTTPAGEVVSHDLAKGTPIHPDGTSAASHGTNVACEAVGFDGPVRIYGGTVCRK